MGTQRLDALMKASRTVTAPSAEARERHRRRLASTLAASAVVGAATSVAPGVAAAASRGLASLGVAGPSTALLGGFAKWGVASVVLATTLTGAGVYLARSRDVATPIARPSPMQVVETPAPPAPVSVADEEGAAPPATRPPPRAAGGATPKPQSLERELRLLRSASRALDTGSPAQALTLLDRYGEEFPHGALAVEYQAERVLALCAAGKVAAAR